MLLLHIYYIVFALTLIGTAICCYYIVFALTLIGTAIWGGGELRSHLILGSEFQLIDNDNKDTLKVLSGVV